LIHNKKWKGDKSMGIFSICVINKVHYQPVRRRL
ncbi:TPA: erythromycin resistance leader peptide, partial [Staphylococcus aureus]|nr:erythromycin resistance leader peptide [Staphylococcus aureus]